MRFNQKVLAIGSFVLGIGVAIIVFTVPGLHQAAIDIERAGYAGAFFAGILYAINITAATATTIFVQMPDRFNPVLVALLGGAGAVLYDLTVFTLFRRGSHTTFMENIKNHLPGRQRWPAWLTQIVGIVLIASPLPDELGAGFFGSTAITPKRFTIISFFANAGGIFILQFTAHG